MAKIPDKVKNLSLIRSLSPWLITQGKVRDTYEIPGLPDALLQVATNRVSIFDFVLPFTVPQKGEVLTAVSHYEFTQVIADIPHHLLDVSQGSLYELIRGLRTIHSDIPLERCAVVRRARVIPLEFIFRMMLGGSVYQGYLKDGMVAGTKLPPGIKKWSKFDQPMFTPSTKAAEGHDENITVRRALALLASFGALEAPLVCQAAYERAYQQAEAKGFVILDTKLEVGKTGDGTLLIIDEAFTPDSSRITTHQEWQEALEQGKDPRSHDKQFIRDWGATIKTPFHDTDGNPLTGLNNLDPANEAHLAFVAQLAVPEEVIAETSKRYLKLCGELIGYELKEYQQKFLLMN